jgi:hypothetical protein
MDTVHIEKLRKQRFFYYCIAIGTAVTLGFVVIDYIEGEVFEVILDLIFAGVLVTSYFFMRWLNNDMLIYRVGLFFLSLVYLYAMYTGTGDGTILYWMFILPLIYLFFLGKQEGSIWSIMALGVMGIILFLPNSYPYGLNTGYRFLLAFVFATVFAIGLESSRHRFSQLFAKERRRLIAEKRRLEKALGQIKTLSGLLPICANCKKIRDDEGYWHDVAVYVREHSNADFSHGICPDCVNNLYSQIQNKKK